MSRMKPLMRAASPLTTPASSPTSLSTGEVGEDVRPQRSRTDLLHLWSAALICPCHFPVIVLLLLGGTALGAFFHGHVVLLFGLSAAYFTVALLTGMWLLRRQQTATRVITCTMRGVERHKSCGGPPEAAEGGHPVVDTEGLA